MVLLDVLGRRWALRLGWELRDGALSFNDLQRACDGISPSVLSQRLREEIAAGIVERTADLRYRLSAGGRALLPIMRRLDRWAERLATPAPGRAGRRRRQRASSRSGRRP